MATGIRDKVAILGMGCSKFGERWDKSVGDLLVDAATEAVNPLPFSTGLVVLIIFSVAALVAVEQHPGDGQVRGRIAGGQVAPVDDPGDRAGRRRQGRCRPQQRLVRPGPDQQAHGKQGTAQTGQSSRTCSHEPA